MTLTACYILKNESEKIERSLNSIKDLVNEIVVVVDSTSTDDTFEICGKWKTANKFNLKLFSREWTNNFAEARNYSIGKATSDYILIIDGDEWIEESEHFKILNAIDLKFDTYTMFQRNLQSNGNTLDVKHYRIFKNNGKILYSAASHENINHEGCSNHDFDGYIMHDGYIMTHEEMLIKAQRNIELHLKQLETEPENKMTAFYLARCYAQIGEYDLAGTFATLALAEELPNDHRGQMCLLLHDVWIKKDNPFLAIQFLLKSIKLVPKQRKGRWEMARFFEFNKKYREAIDELEYILSINNIYTDLTGDIKIKESQILNNINSNRQQLKEIQNANI